MAFMFPVVTPRMPAINVVVWLPNWPMRMAPNSRPPPVLPISILLSPVMFEPALKPKAMLLLPVVLILRALKPMAVLKSPSVLLKRALTPEAVLAPPPMLFRSA